MVFTRIGYSVTLFSFSFSSSSSSSSAASVLPNSKTHLSLSAGCWGPTCATRVSPLQRERQRRETTAARRPEEGDRLAGFTHRFFLSIRVKINQLMVLGFCN
jgi:hypothetical protein